jgi:dTDP-4-dehydrorhamnose 3,5-epimerase
MPFINTSFDGLLVFEPEIFADSRGYFFESYNQKLFTENAIDLQFIQDNQAQSGYGVIRGLHYQSPPFSQTKLVRVLSGAILDAVVDLRKDSTMFGKSFTIELSAENKKQVLVPRGFAHGYSVLSKTAEVFYKCDNYWHKESEGGIMYNDPHMDIDWKIPPGQEIISQKDMNYLPFLTKDFPF